MHVQLWVADEDEDNTGYKGLKDLELPGHSGHIASHLTWPCVSPGHFCYISHTGDAGEDCGADGEFSGRPVSHEPHTGDRVDDGRRQAEEDTVGGAGDGEIQPGQGEAALESTQLQAEDQQGHGETEAPGEHAPVGHGAHPGTLVGH